MYFSNRTFKIKLNDFLSKLFDLFRGVPQGSILAPLLFSLFYNGVGSSLLAAFYGLFADDLSFYLFNSNLEELVSSLSKVLESLHKWCADKDLVINFAKTKFMIISKKHLNTSVPQLICNDNNIEYVSEFKYLGVIFDSTLAFDSHFHHVCKRVSAAVGCLMFIKRFLNLRVFKVLLNSFILSIIDYGLPIWGQLSNSQLNVLQSKVNSILGAYFYPQICNKFERVNRIAHNCEKRKYKSVNLDFNELYEKCNILTVSERLQYFCAIFAFKSIRFNFLPEISQNFVFGKSSRHQNLIVPTHKTSFFQKSVIYHSILIWNALDTEAKQPNVSLSKFKTFVNQALLRQRTDEFVSV